MTKNIKIFFKLLISVVNDRRNPEIDGEFHAGQWRLKLLPTFSQLLE